MIQRYFTKEKRQEEFFSYFAKEGVRAGVFLILGFLFSNAILFKSLSPLGLGLIGVLNGLNLYSCVCGVILGHCLGASAGIVIKYIGATVISVFIKWLVSYLKSERLKRAISIFSSGIGLLISGAVLTSLLTPDLYSFLSLLIECSFTVISTILFSSALSAISFKRPICKMGIIEVAGVLLTVGAVVIALCALEVFGASFGVILSIFLTLLIAYNSGASAGAAVGAVLGIFLLIYDDSLIYTCLGLGFGGLLAGAFRSLKKSRMALIFFVSNVFTGFLCLSDAKIGALLIESGVGCLLFFAFGFESDFLSHITSPESHSSLLNDFKAVFDRRLSLTSEGLSEIGDITKKVALKLERRHESGERRVFEETAEKLCDSCSMHDFCWGKNKAKVTEAFESTSPILRQKGYLAAEDMPSFFINSCIKSRDLLRNLNLSYSEFIEKTAYNHSLSSVRSVICEQFDSMALMLTKLKEELSRVRGVKSDVSDKFAAQLRLMGLSVGYCLASERDFERICVEVQIEKFENESVPDRKLISILNSITSREFDYPCVRSVGDKLYYTFNEMPCFDLDYKILQTSLDPSNISGDSISCFCDCEQFFNIILSDGMGAGKRAAVDSKMTVSLITKLIKAGFHYDNAVEVVNSAMLVKSSDETLSTVDALRLDLYTGKLQLMKLGAAPTFIYKSGERVHTIEAQSLPIGILGGVKPQKNQLYLKSSDLIVMVSDGVCDDEIMWLETLISQNHSLSVSQLCEKILRESEVQNKLKDDRTVLVARVISSNKKSPI